MVLVAACNANVFTGPPPTVAFVLDAPLCSSVLPVQFTIDQLVVGQDTFRVHVANPHTRTRPIRSTEGTHVLGARVVGGFVFPDRTVTLVSGDALVDTLSFYCS